MQTDDPAMFPTEDPDSSPILTDRQKARIRAEEIYRACVREEVTAPRKGFAKLFAFLNSPLGILFISSFVLSGATAIYSHHQDEKEKIRAKNEEVIKLSDEIAFRERGLDDALKIVERDAETFAQFPRSVPAPTLQRDVDGYSLECKKVAATVRAGGLISPPGDPPKPVFRYRDIRLDTDLVEYWQGYKSPDYKFLDVKDLAIKRWALIYIDQPPPAEELKRLDNALYELDEAGYLLVRSQDLWPGLTGTVEPPITDPRKLAKVMAPLIKKVRDEFDLVRYCVLLSKPPSSKT